MTDFEIIKKHYVQLANKSKFSYTALEEEHFNAIEKELQVPRIIKQILTGRHFSYEIVNETKNLYCVKVFWVNDPIFMLNVKKKDFNLLKEYFEDETK